MNGDIPQLMNAFVYHAINWSVFHMQMLQHLVHFMPVPLLVLVLKFKSHRPPNSIKRSITKFESNVQRSMESDKTTKSVSSQIIRIYIVETVSAQPRLKRYIESK